MPLASFETWMLWGALLLVALPVLIIALGELADDAATLPEWRAFTKPLLITRNGVVPFAFAAILLRQVAGLSANLWIIVLNAALAFMNVLLFDDNSKSSSRVRIPRLLLDILRFIFVVCGAAITISTIWGVNLGSLVTALGVGSVVIGLALQDTLGSLFSGIAMVSARQFRAGDWVRFGNDEGPILSQNWRTVTIKTRSGDALIIPNGVIARAPLTVIAGGAGNTTVGVDLKFPYQYSPDMIVKLLAEAATMTNGFVLDPAPVARVSSFDDNAIRYGMGVRAVDPQKLFAVRSEFLTNVWFLAQRNGVALTGQLNDSYVLPPSMQPPATDTADALIKRVTAAKDFAYANADLMTLLQRGRVERYRDGQVLVERGTVSAQVYILLSGRVRAVQKDDKGGEVLLHTFEPGQFILAKATLRAAATPFSLKAIGESEVVAAPVADFKAFCAGDIALAQEFEQILSAREDAAHRALAKANNEQVSVSGDRAQILKDLFK
jgi:small-conductance mechanosensitive channel/CRP-like cAMP-binding protein